MPRSVLVATVLLSAACSGPSPAPTVPERPPELRLPRDVRPLAYRLELTVAPERDRFSGRVEIDVDLARPAPVIWMHGSDLQVGEASVEVAGERIAATFSQVRPDGMARLVAARTLPRGRATLRLSFGAPWGEALFGLYRARHRGLAYAITQHEAISARRTFPCFDEPAFKTPFEVTLLVPAGDVAVSNSPVLSEKPVDEGMKRVRFAPTPPLPTYLVFAGVGPFDVVTPAPLPPNEVRSRPLPMRGLAPRGQGAELAFSLETAARMLPVLERWFGIPFPYDKLDHLAVPDFAAGAMENAGAITYRDTLLLVDPVRTPEATRLHIGLVIAHEMAHQWFGDLVTLPWWNDVWLNESFATWMEGKVLAAWRPAAMSDLESLRRVHATMEADGLASARAIRQPLLRTADVEGQFDLMSYEKGAAVIDMFARYMGEDRFRAAVRAWLEANAHGTGTTGGLLTEISRAAGRDLAGPFESFLDRPGVPLVSARLACDGSGARLELSQSRWLPVGSGAPGDVRWKVPVCARFEFAGSAREACTLLEGARGTLPLPACPAWVMPNAGAVGYYRWTLGPEDLAHLRDRGLVHLTPQERLSYADALAAGARSATLPWAEAMAGLVPLAADPLGPVAAAPMHFLEATEEDLVSDAIRPRARSLASALYRPRLAELGWEPRPGEPWERRKLREQVVEFLVWTARDPEVRREAARRGRAYAGIADGAFHPEAVSPDLADVALAAAVDEGDEALFSALEARLFAAQDGDTRQRILQALGRVTAPALSARVLRLAGDRRLRVNERTRPLYFQALSAETREAAFSAFRARFDALAPTLPSTSADYLPRIFRGFCDGGKARELRAFLEPRLARFPGARRSLAQATESIELCAALRQAQGASAEASLSTRQAGAPPRGSARLGR